MDESSEVIPHRERRTDPPIRNLDADRVSGRRQVVVEVRGDDSKWRMRRGQANERRMGRVRSRILALDDLTRVSVNIERRGH
jgi:hypothetical protein